MAARRGRGQTNPYRSFLHVTEPASHRDAEKRGVRRPPIPKAFSGLFSMLLILPRSGSARKRSMLRPHAGAWRRSGPPTIRPCARSRRCAAGAPLFLAVGTGTACGGPPSDQHRGAGDPGHHRGHRRVRRGPDPLEPEARDSVAPEYPPVRPLAAQRLRYRRRGRSEPKEDYGADRPLQHRRRAKVHPPRRPLAQHPDRAPVPQEA